MDKINSPTNPPVLLDNWYKNLEMRLSEEAKRLIKEDRVTIEEGRSEPYITSFGAGK